MLTFTISRLLCPLTGIYKFSCHWQAILDWVFGMRDFPYLKAGTRNFKAKWERDSGLTKTIMTALNNPIEDLHLSYNQLQKYLRHCTVFWLKRLVHDLILLIPLHPFSKLLVIQDLEERILVEGRSVLHLKDP